MDTPISVIKPPATVNPAGISPSQIQAMIKEAAGVRYREPAALDTPE
jgi:hypothetical protein